VRERLAGSTRLTALRAALEQIGLPAWFVAVDLLWIAKPGVLGIDARHYQRATDAWLAGGNPWEVAESGIRYAAGPHTLLIYVPTSPLPVWLATWIWMIAGVVACLWLIRRLGLPWWWVLFPPLAHSAWNGNPQTIALAFLVAGGPVAASVAGIVKLYALVPLVGHWRDLTVAIVVLFVTLPIVPWQLYLESGLGIAHILETAWNGSSWRLPPLIPFVLLALWALRSDGARWFAIPALWPGTQFYYTAMALPAIRGRKLVAAALALPAVLIAPLVVVVLGLQAAGAGPWLQRRLARFRRV
jgi:hypothetical protein